ncbi:MAG: deoxyribodipyrimidine photolyase [Polyangiaceae bacterium]
MPVSAPSLRLRQVNAAPVDPHGRYVLYWMTAARRTRHNFALDHALAWARELGVGVIVLEALRVDYPWSSDRLHRFVLDGMADNLGRFEASPVHYYPYVEPTVGAGRGLLEALAERACVVVTDDFPCFFLPRMLAAAGDKLRVRLDAVDGNGLLPMRAADRVFGRAFDFRRFLQKTLAPHLSSAPRADPLRNLQLAAVRPATEILRRYPAAELSALRAPGGLARFPIDHTVSLAALSGGEAAARKQLASFITRLSSYEQRNHPDEDASSGLSPYLHFGHVSVHDVFARVVAQEEWTSDAVSSRCAGQREGWWGMSQAAESFLDELVTWRELGYNFCSQRQDYAEFSSLPEWARATLAKHAKDPRSHLYSSTELEQGKTHDDLWNAAARQLRDEGRMHNYLRMLWGKNILLWSESPQVALEVMIHLNNKYALDGRNPNSYSGIFWVLGRYDRPWAPERPVLGTLRYMTTASTKKKLRVKRYLERFGDAPSLFR